MNERLDPFLEDLASRQRNTLPPDLIANDRHVDDVLWHGPRRNSWIQRAGCIVIGGTLLLIGAIGVVTYFRLGARLFLIPMLVITGAGARVLWFGMRPKR